jgi:hypothetical protein
METGKGIEGYVNSYENKVCLRREKRKMRKTKEIVNIEW